MVHFRFAQNQNRKRIEAALIIRHLQIRGPGCTGCDVIDSKEFGPRQYEPTLTTQIKIVQQQYLTTERRKKKSGSWMKINTSLQRAYIISCSSTEANKCFKIEKRTSNILEYLSYLCFVRHYWRKQSVSKTGPVHQTTRVFGAPNSLFATDVGSFSRGGPWGRSCWFLLISIELDATENGPQLLDYSVSELEFCAPSLLLQ